MRRSQEVHIKQDINSKMKFIKKLLIGLGTATAGLLLFGGLVANGAANPPALGGTGTSTLPAKGSLLIGATSSQYGVLPVGANGLCPVASSGAQFGIAWSSCDATSFSTTTINNALGPIFNFVASSTGSVLSITSSTSGGSSTIKWILDLSTYLTKAILTLNGASSTAQTIVGGTGNSVATVSGATNSTTTITNTGVTSFTGQGCVTAANSTGTVALTVTCISGNQSITFVIAGDATGTASGATSITDSITVTGLNGKVLPANTTGTLQFSGGAWAINLATSSLGVYNAAGVLSSYLGSSCGGGTFVTGFSATGTVACGTPSGTGTVTQLTAGTGISLTPTNPITTTGTITNIGVTSLAGGGCVSVPNATGSITLSVTCLSGNQTITFVASGDATGTATGATSINDSITVTGLNGKALPANTTGTLQFSGGAWSINLATSSLGVYNSAGVLSSFAGSACSGGQAVNGIGATGAVTGCFTPAGGSGSSTPKLATLIVSSQTGADYPNSTAGVASATLAIQNITNFPNGGLVWFPDATYNIAGTSTMGKLVSNVYWQGNGGTTINWPAPTKTTALVSVSSTITTPAQHCGLSGFNFINTSGTFAGYALDMSNANQCQFLNSQSFNFQYAQKIDDTQNLTFKNLTENWNSFDNGGLFASSTNPANDNIWINFAVNPDQDQLASSGNKYYGVYINHSQHLLFINFNCEPAVLSGVFATSTVCANLVNATSADPIYGITFQNPWFEGAATGTVIGAGVNGTTISGGIMDTNGATGGASIQDAGTDTNILGLNDNFSGFVWKYGSVQTFSFANASQLLSTDASKNVTSTAVGSYLGLSGGILTVSSTVASSSITFNIYDATSTSPYRFSKWQTQTAMTVAKVSCDEQASATTTIELFKTSTIATTTVGADVVASIACGKAGQTTTTFGTATLSAGDYLIANVSSTAGTPQWTTVSVFYKKT